ncbi:MAG: peptidyl-prolyl cis-trans isomerase [Calditerrivibrio sp.]|nr:peptidyl-prolyl cis-trans isomerase [Calditerrivibrio sp.]
MKKIYLILFAVSLLLTACEKAKTVITRSNEKPVVIIGNEKYYQKDIIEYIYFELPDIDLSSLNDNDFKQEILNSFIRHKLILLEAKKTKINIDKNMVKNLYNKLNPNQNSNEINEKYEKFISEKILAQKFIEEKIKSEIKISDEELKEYYNEFIKSRTGKIYYHIYQIVNDDKQKIEEAAKLLKSGRSFEEVAKTYSTGPEAENGGDMGVIDLESFPPVFDIVMKMKPGDISKIISSEYGYHILLLKEIIPSENPSFEEIKDLLRDELLSTKWDQYLENYVKEKMKDVKIEINPNFNFIHDNSTNVKK